MEITINNFKAITSPFNIDLNGMHVIAGQNSGGKSSLIHALLFLKQNIEDMTETDSLKFNAPYLSLGKFSDVVSSNINDGMMDFTFKLNEMEIPTTRILSRISRKTSLKEISLNIKIRHVKQKYKIYKSYVETATVKINNQLEINYIRTKGNRYDVTIDDELIPLVIGITGGFSHEKIAKSTIKSKIDSGNISLDSVYLECQNSLFRIPLVDILSRTIRKKLSDILYIGPLRESPKNYYYFEDGGSNQVGIRGEFTPQFLARKLNHQTLYKKVNENGEVDNEFTESNLYEATNYWICEHFKLGKNLTLDKDSNGVLYQINLESNITGKKSSINNVGFGISQILPIIVQSMAMKQGCTLILEQPEIHLHPTAQAKLFDFFNSLTKSSKSVIVETHSDHLVTRLRRRVAESHDSLQDSIKLTFVEYDEEIQSSLYKTLKLDELGNINNWPKGFFDQYDSDIRAMLKAQIEKKKTRTKS